MVIPVKHNTLFESYLTWLNPVLKLQEYEIKVLAAFLTLHYTYTKLEYNPILLNELLFSDKTKEALAEKLKMPYQYFEKIYISLISKGVLTGEEISPKLTKYPKDGIFKFNVEFKISK